MAEASTLRKEDSNHNATEDTGMFPVECGHSPDTAEGRAEAETVESKRKIGNATRILRRQVWPAKQRGDDIALAFNR